MSSISEQADKMSMKSHQSRVNFARSANRLPKKKETSPKPKQLTKGLLSKFDDSNSGSLPRIGEVTGKKKKQQQPSKLEMQMAAKQFQALHNKSIAVGLGESSRKALSTLDTISHSNSNASTSKLRLGKFQGSHGVKSNRKLANSLGQSCSNKRLHGMGQTAYLNMQQFQ